ncbi:MAG: hypothetical protein BMS9Abin07_0950 [Acidimicrobiia bacterium]|nr:MAG: hypothetical protein BMS9Abin07_0950 [Acidimicrobiia bacterium]
MSDLAFYLVLIAATIGVLLISRSRHAWRLNAVGGVLAGIFIPVAFVFLLVVFIAQPSFGAIVLIGAVLFVPAFLYSLVWWESGPPDPFKPASERALQAHSGLGEVLEGMGLQFRAAAVGRRSLGVPSFIYSRQADQLIVLIVGSNPDGASVYVYSLIADHSAVLCTTYLSGVRPPGEVRQRLPSEPLTALIDLHLEAARFLTSKGFRVTAEIEDDPLGFLRFLAAIERQNRSRPLRFLFSMAFGDVLDPLTRPLAAQRGIERRLPNLPLR